MEDIFIQALITRSYNETDLLDKLPEDIKLMIDDKLSEFNEAMEQIEPTPQQPTLEERVAELQQVIVELTTVLNDKGIAP